MREEEGEKEKGKESVVVRTGVDTGAGGRSKGGVEAGKWTEDQ